METQPKNQNEQQRATKGIFRSQKALRGECMEVNKMADSEEGDSELLNLNVNKFLAEVQLYECLYNKYSRDFKNKYKKINCWKKVAEKVGLSAEAAEKKFTSLRGSYTRYLRNTKSLPSGSGRDAAKAEKYKCMEWLLPYIDHRQTTTNLKDKSPDHSNFSLKDSSQSTSRLVSAFNEACGLDETESSIGDVEEIEADDEDHEGNDNSQMADSLDSIKEIAEEDIVSPETGTESEPGSAYNSVPKEQVKGVERVKIKKSQSKEKTSQSKKRPWAKPSVKLSREEFDNAILKTANSLEEHLKKNEDACAASQEQNATDKDADSLFCRSLIPRFKRLPEISKAVLRVEIERVFLQTELQVSSSPSQSQIQLPQVANRLPSFSHPNQNIANNQSSSYTQRQVQLSAHPNNFVPSIHVNSYQNATNSLQSGNQPNSYQGRNNNQYEFLTHKNSYQCDNNCTTNQIPVSAHIKSAEVTSNSHSYQLPGGGLNQRQFQECRPDPMDEPSEPTVKSYTQL